MEEDKKELLIEVKYEGKDYSIPFKTFDSLDEFTSKFENKTELIKALFPTFKNKPEVFRIKYKYKTSYKDQNGNRIAKYKTIYPQIKYSIDNFDEKDLQKQFLNFMKLHPNLALDEYWGIIYIIDNRRIKNKIDGYITTSEIEYAVEYIFNKGYKTKRDIYFKLKEIGIKVKINENETKYKTNKFTPSNRIQEFEMRDKYQEYLQEYSLRGEEEANKAMEELSLYDLDKLPRKNINGSSTPLFDGTDVIELYPEDNIEDILNKTQKLTAEHRKKIINLLLSYRNAKNGKKRCKK